MSSRLPNTSARRAPAPLAVLLREPFFALNDDIERNLAARGHSQLRATHGNVFQFLDDAGTRVSVLATRAQVTKQSMGELVAHLEAHGYVERVPDPSDRRAKLVRTTALGRRAIRVARAAVADAEARWSERLGRAKMHRLRELLEELNRVPLSADPADGVQVDVHPEGRSPV